MVGRGPDSEGPWEGAERPGQWDSASLSGAAPHSGTTFEIVGSVGFALMIIAVCLVLADRLPTVTFPLAPVGSMALSVYTAQVVTISIIGADNEDNRPWLAFVLATLLLATLWRLTLGRGPLERLLTWSSTRAARSTPARSTEPRLSSTSAPGGHTGPVSSTRRQ